MILLRRAEQFGKELALASLHLLYPPTCALCSRELERSPSSLEFICDLCLSGLENLEKPWCLQCGDPIENSEVDLCERCAHESVGFDLCRSYGLYEGPLARLIQIFKYEGERALTHDLAPLLKQVIEVERLNGDFDAITFVPMRRKRKHERGYNQSELLARSLGKLIDRPVVATLKKIRETMPQMKLEGEARRVNLAGAFVPLNGALPKRLLIIDDVFTTGSTLSECARHSGKLISGASQH